MSGGMDAGAAPRPPIGRRRVLGILAAAAGLPLLPGAVRRAAGRAPVVHTWRGRALGAPAAMTLVHPDRTTAQRLIAACLDEVARLERIFSLYHPDSELVRLNRTGRLTAASLELRALLAEARRLGVASGGAFDVTVQPLWRLYARHFAHPGADPAGPDPRAVEAARALVGVAGVDLSGGAVALARPGMALTLNGIAQGYVTDRVADLLRARGFDRVLVRFGETAGLNPPDGGRPWRIGVADPVRPERRIATVELVNRAVATSSGFGTPFDRQARHHHIFDPATGLSARRHRSVTVVADRATVADALATALYVMPPDAAAGLVRHAGGAQAILVDAAGRVREIRAEAT